MEYTENFELRDKRNGEWAWVYNSVIKDPHLSSNDVRIYSGLASFGEGKNIYPSITGITKRTTLPRRTTIRSLKKLEFVGYIKIFKKRGIQNSYELLKRPKGCNQCHGGTSPTSAKIDTNQCQNVHGTSATVAPKKDNRERYIEIRKNLKIKELDKLKEQLIKKKTIKYIC